MTGVEFRVASGSPVAPLGIKDIELDLAYFKPWLQHSWILFLHFGD